jgi:arylsulfatase A-like enzyme
VGVESRAALLTGLEAGRALVQGSNGLWLSAEARTVAEILKPAGYRSGAIGLWGLGKPDREAGPNERGFGEWFGYLQENDANEFYPKQLWRNKMRTLVMAPGETNAPYAHDYFTRAATNFLKINKDNPFFLYLAFTLPRANAERKKDGLAVPSDRPYSKERWAQAERNYAAMVTRVDESVGRIVDKLKELGIEEKTAIFFSSDNGPHSEGGHQAAFFQSAGPARGGKGDLYEGGIRVPMVVRWPGKVKGGAVNDQVWAFWDFLPTVAEMAGVSKPDKLDGISMFPTLTDRPQTNQHHNLYWEVEKPVLAQAVRSGDWKAVRIQSGKEVELYNLKNDPGEKRNVASRNRATVQQLEKIMTERDERRSR